MARQIFYIINPISGTRKKKNLVSFIEQETYKRNIPFKIFPSVANGDYSFVKASIKKETDIVVAGGDGTISQVVASLMKEPVRFGIIPCGSGNGLANSARIPSRPEKALQIIFDGESKPVDGFFINDHFSCMLCGL